MTESKSPAIGCHMSIAGGFYRALELGAEEDCDCVQIFTTPPRIWPAPDPSLPKSQQTSRVKPITEDDVRRFRTAQEVTKINATLAHASYLLNLASPDDLLWQRSVDGLLLEMQRADRLTVPAVVLHPGAFTSSSESAGLTRIVQALDQLDERLGKSAVRCLLENTAGQGSNLGYRFEHLAEILTRVANPSRLGVCIDTCHLFAAGYPLESEAEYEQTTKQLGDTVGLDQVHAFHLNDSKQPLGSRKDRHEHIGQGEMGLEPFRRLVNDQRFRHVPMYLETPKGKHGKRSWDAVNLQTLRQLIEPSSLSAEQA